MRTFHTTNLNASPVAPKFANGHTVDSVVSLFKRIAEEHRDYHYSFFGPESERMMNNKILYTLRTWSIELGKYGWKVTDIPLNQVRLWVSFTQKKQQKLSPEKIFLFADEAFTTLEEAKRSFKDLEGFDKVKWECRDIDTQRVWIAEIPGFKRKPGPGHLYRNTPVKMLLVIREVRVVAAH